MYIRVFSSYQYVHSYDVTASCISFKLFHVCDLWCLSIIST